MNDISEDAIAEAHKLWAQANDPNGPGALGIAIALQKFMDQCEDKAEQRIAALVSGLRWALENEDDELRARVEALADEYEDEDEDES